jgi:hypothetical protein
MFNPTLIVIEAFIGELRRMYEQTYGLLRSQDLPITCCCQRVLPKRSSCSIDLSELHDRAVHNFGDRFYSFTIRSI